MSSPDPRTRIITHMNANHQASLRHYLQHYCRIPSSLATDAKLVDIELDHMILKSSGGRNIIPFSPPMSSWKDVRERLLEMHHTALKGLGLSDIIATEYRRPRGFHLVVFATCALVMIAFSRATNFTEDSLFYRVFGLRHLDRLARFCHTIQPLLIVSMVAIHGVEATWMAHDRLRRHGIQRFSGLWWKWICSNFVEGYGAWVRFDQMVEEKKSGKH